MVFVGKKSCFGISVLFLLTAFVGIQSTGAAAGAPPVVLAGGPYESYECNSILFDASGSYDLEGAALVYRWNFNGSWTGWSTFPYAEYMWRDDFSGTIMLEISDGDLVSSAMVDVLVLNVPPFILSMDGPASSAKAISQMAVTVHCFDGDPRENIASLDTCTAMFSWGDSTSTSYPVDVGIAVVVGSHVYAKAGQYIVTITLTDDDGGAAQESTQVLVDQSAASIGTLIASITSSKIPKGLENSLLSKLGVVDSSLGTHKMLAEMNKLKAFINLVEAQRGKQLSKEQADELINTAQAVIDSLKIM